MRVLRIVTLTGNAVAILASSVFIAIVVHSAQTKHERSTRQLLELRAKTSEMDILIRAKERELAVLRGQLIVKGTNVGENETPPVLR